MISEIHGGKRCILVPLIVVLLIAALSLSLTSCETLLGLAFLLLDTSDSVLVASWNVSPSYPDAAAVNWCRGLCRFKGYTYDRVERDRYSRGDILRCYGRR